MVTPARFTGEKAEWLVAELPAFSIAYFDGTLKDLLPDLLSRFHRRFPDVPGLGVNHENLTSEEHAVVAEYLTVENRVRSI
jgi:hypothetical protein